VEPERAGIARMLAAAERNIADARLAALSAENRFDAAYKAILQCAMLALRANGFRTLTSQAGHHQTALQTLPLTIGLAKDRMILLDLMRFIQARLEEQGARVADELPFNTPSSVVEFAQSVLPHDDSSLQWSPPGSGRSNDPSKTLEQLFDRMVMRFEERPAPSVRSDEDVWRNFRRNLEERRLLQHFQPRKIAVQDDEVEFQYAWKNGVWHCLEPLSFDLALAESIRDKAHRWLGQMASLKDAPEQSKVYLLLGAPQQEELKPAFANAISILRKIPGNKEIVLEQDAPQLAAKIEKEVQVHQRP
jgi:hypothetical protein